MLKPSLQLLDQRISVQEFTADTTQSEAVVSGSARNMLNWPVESCLIKVTFYDYQGMVVGTGTKEHSRLEAGEVWDFQVQLKGADAWKVARYAIEASCK